MTLRPLLIYAPMLALLILAAGIDLRHRKIPNWITIPLALVGLLQSLMPGDNYQFTDSLYGFAVGFSLPFVMFAIGALGGGDVKLMAAVGAWVGPWRAFEIFLLAAVVGMLVVLGQALVQKRLATLFRNTAVLTLNFVHLSDVGVEHATETGKSCHSVDRPLPYAVPILMAALILMGTAWKNGRLQ